MPGFHPDPATPRSSRFNMKSDLASARRSAESGRNLFSDLLKFSFRFYQQSFQTKAAPGNWVTGSLTLVSRWTVNSKCDFCQLLVNYSTSPWGEAAWAEGGTKGKGSEFRMRKPDSSSCYRHCSVSVGPDLRFL